MQKSNRGQVRQITIFLLTILLLGASIFAAADSGIIEFNQTTTENISDVQDFESVEQSILETTDSSNPGVSTTLETTNTSNTNSTPFQTSLELSYSPSSITLGDLVFVSVSLTYLDAALNQQPLSSKQVELIVSDILTSTQTTSEEGIATFNFDTTNHLPNVYSLLARFAGDSEFESSTTSVDVEFSALAELDSFNSSGSLADSGLISIPVETEEPVVEETNEQTFISTILSLFTSAKAYLGDLVTVEATLTYENLTPISNQDIDFYTNFNQETEYLGTSTTDQAGVAEFDWNTSLYQSGIYQIIANYSNNAVVNTNIQTTELELIELTESHVSFSLTDKYGAEYGSYTLLINSDASFNLEIIGEQTQTGFGVQASAPAPEVIIQGLTNVPENLTAVIGEYQGVIPSSIVVNTPVFAIDEVEIDSATIKLPKSGDINKIFTCKDFDKENFNCQNWETTNLDFIDHGDYIEFSVEHFSAYMGGEIVAINAEHLTENYSFISNIFSDVETKDDIWSEAIYEGEIVRVTYETELQNGNWIDVVVRSNNTVAYFDIYEAGTNHKVARSGTTSFEETQYMQVQNLTKPTDTFDFKVVKVLGDAEGVDECLAACQLECSEDSGDFTETECNDDCDLGCYSTIDDHSRTTFLEFDYIHDAEVNATNADGIVAYGELNVQTPRYRTFDVTKDFSAEQTDALAVGGDITWTKLEGAPLRDEMVLGTLDKNNDVNIQIYTAGVGWHNLTEVSVDVENSAYRSFDIAYEDYTGDALIVYEDSSSAGNSQIKYRTWDGTDYSAEGTITTDLLNSVNRWVALYPQHGTDDIMLLVVTFNGDGFAIPWNGTGFVGELNSTFTTTLSSVSIEDFAFEWETKSGDGLLFYAEGGLHQYHTYNATDAPYWGAAQTFDTGNNMDALRLCSDKYSDYIGIAVVDAGSDAEMRMWNGTDILASPPTADSKVEPSGTNNINTDCAFYNSTNAIFGFIDDRGQAIDYVTFTKPNTWSTTDLTTTDITANFATDDIGSLRFTENPVTDEVMAIAMDIAEDITAIRWDGSAWQSVTASPIEATTEVINGDQEGVMFAWYGYDRAPLVTNLSVAEDPLNAGDPQLITVNVTDNINVSQVIARITMPNSTVENLTMTDDDANDYYNATFTRTQTTGLYTVQIIANDSDNNINDDETTTFTVAVADTENPKVFELLPVNQTDYNLSNTIEIAANVTDDSFGVHTVQANVTYPNGTLEVLTLTNGTDHPDKYNASFNPPALLGNYNVSFFANDTANKINATESTNFTLNDVLAPAVDLNYPIADFNTTATTLSFNWTATDDFNTSLLCNLTINGVVNVTEYESLNGTATNYSVSGFNDGAHPWNVTCVDSSDNTNTSETRTVYVDTVAPSVTAINYPTAFQNISASSLRINATVSDVTTAIDTVIFQISNSSNPFNVTTSTTDSSEYNATIIFTDYAVEDGQHTITVYVNDTAGNLNDSETRIFTLDRVSPSVSYYSPIEGENFTGGSTVLNVSVTDATTSVESVIFQVSNSSDPFNITATASNATNYNATLDFATYGLADGTHTITVYVNDSADNLNDSETRTITLDTTDPTITFVDVTDNSSTITSNTFIQINTTAADATSDIKNITIELFNSDATLNSTNASTTSPYPINYTNLADGVYYFNATVYDVPGNFNYTETRNLTVDTTDPTISFIDTTTNSSNQTATWIFANVTAADTNLDTVNITLFNSTLDLINSSSSTTSPTEINFTNLNDGTYYLNATANDSASNTAITETRTILIDTNAPSVDLNFPVVAFNTSETSISFNWTATDSFSGIMGCNLTINSVINASNIDSANATATNYTVSDLSDGIHSWNVTCWDNLDNANTSETRTFTVDSQAPSVDLNLPLNSSFTSLSAINFNWTASNLFDTSLDCNLTIDGSINVSNVASPNNTATNYSVSGFSDGTHPWNVTCIDDAGLTNTSETWQVTVDTTSPIISFVDSTTNATNQTANWIFANVTASDTNFDAINITLFNSTLDLINSSSSTTSPTEINFTNLADGTYYLNSTANDSASNTAITETRTIIIDNINPIISFVDVTDNSSTITSNTFIQINTTTSDAATSIKNITVNLFNSDSTLNSSNASTTSPYPINYTNLADGVYYFNATAYDSAINSASTETRNVTIDTTNPTITFVDSTTNQSNFSQSWIFANVTAADTNLDTINITLFNSTLDLINSSSSITSPTEINFTNLADGTYYLNSTVNDSALNTAITETRIITLDTVNPLVTLVSPANNTLEQSTNSISFVYNVTDTTSDIDNCSLYINDALDQTDSSISKNVNQSFTKVLSNGDHNWSVGCTDYAANSFITANYNVSVNVTAPTVTLENPVDGYNSSSASVTFNCSAIDNSNLVNLTLSVWNSTGSLFYNNSVNVSGTSNQSNWTVALTENENYTWNCEAYDDSFLSDSGDSNYAVNIDTINPSIDYVSVTEADSSYLNRDFIQVNISSSDTTTGVFNTTIYLYDAAKSLQSTDNAFSDLNDANFTALSDGVYYFNATVFDFAGNTNETSERTVTIDTTNPSINFVDQTTSSADLSQSWIFANVTAADTNLDTINITLFNSALNKINSSSSITSPTEVNFTGLADGTYYLNATVNDSAANSNYTETRVITLDTTDPTISFVDTTTNSTNQTATWIFANVTASDTNLDTINITLFNSTLDLINSSSSTSSPIEINFTNLDDGTYYLNSTANDSASNTAITETRTIVVDTVSPTITFVDVTDNSSTITSNTFIQINTTASDSTSGLENITVELFNSDATLNSTNTSTTSPYSINYTSLTDGVYYFNATAFDAATNSANTETRNVTIDTTDPTISFVDTTTNSTNQTATWIFANVTASDTNLDTINITLFNSTLDLINSFSSTTSPSEVNFTGLDDGTYYLNSTANDSASNTAITETRTIVVDTVSPTITFVDVTDNSSTITSNTFIQINTTASDSTSGLENITVELFNSDATLNSTNTSTTSPYPINYTNLADGVYYFNATAFDAATNSANTETRNVTIDTTNPTITFVDVTTNSTNLSQSWIFANVTVVDTNLDTINITLFNSTLDLINSSSSTTSPTEINFTNLGDGTYYLNSTVNDSASNTAITETRVITLDTVSPSISGVTTDPTIPVYNNGSAENVSTTFTSSEYPVNLSFLLYNSTGDLVNQTVNVTLTSSDDLPVNYTIPGDLSDGNYSLNFTIYDLAGNLNLTSLGTIVIDTTFPSITLVTCSPENINLSQSIECNATITDTYLDAIVANVTYPNGTVETQTVENTGSNYNFTFTGTTLIDQYNVTWSVNDSSNNVNTSTIDFNVSDVTSPIITLNSPVDYFNNTSSSTTFNFNVTDNYDSSLNCSIYINGTLNETNTAVSNGTATSFDIGTFENGTYVWNITCNDISDNSVTSDTRTFTIDTVIPTFTSLETTPSSEADLDPNIIVNLTANVSDNITDIDTVIFQYKLSNDTVYTNLTGSLNATGGYNASFNATQNGTYNFRVWANDTAGNSEFSNLVNRTIEYDYTWSRTPSQFTAIVTTALNNVSMGNLTINNTGDFPIEFNITSDSGTTTYNETENFTLAAKGVKFIEVNETAPSSGTKTVALTIATNDSSTSPTSLQTTGNIVVSDQPVITSTFTTPAGETLSVTQGDTNVAFIADYDSIGTGNASNVTFFIDIPSDWTVTFGQLNSSTSEFDSGDNEQLSIEVTIPSDATTGTFNVTANLTGVNASGADLHELGFLFTDSVEVTVNAAASVLGAEVTEEAGVGGGQTTSSTTGGSAGSAGVGGGSGAALSGKVLEDEYIQILRGTDEQFPITVKNENAGGFLKNVQVELDGFISQYVTVTPEMIDFIRPQESEDFTASIFVPDYISEGDYIMTARITGDLVPVNAVAAGFSRRSFSETQNFVLRVIEVKEGDLSTYINTAESCIEEMQQAGFPTSKVEGMLVEAKSEIEIKNFNNALELLEEICSIKDIAFETYELILELEERIQEAIDKGFHVPGTIEELELAKIAFAREDFSLAGDRAKEAQLEYIFETRGQFDIINFTAEYWWQLIIGLIVFFFFLICFYKRIRMFILNHRMKSLDKEEENILGLIKEAQDNYLKRKIISDTQYNRYLNQYTKRLTKIKQIRLKLRTKRAVTFDAYQELKDLQKEKKHTMSLIKKTQQLYFIKRKLSSDQFKYEHQSHKSRLNAIIVEEKLIKQRIVHHKKKNKFVHIVMNLCSPRKLFSILKRKK